MIDDYTAEDRLGGIEGEMPDEGPTVAKVLRAVLAVDEHGDVMLVSHHPPCDGLDHILEHTADVATAFGAGDLEVGVYRWEGRFVPPDMHFSRHRYLYEAEDARLEGEFEPLLPREWVETFTGERRLAPHPYTYPIDWNLAPEVKR